VLEAWHKECKFKKRMNKTKLKERKDYYIEDSPSLNSDKPVSRQFEDAHYGYYGWPNYWGGPYMWGVYPDIVRDREKWKESILHEKAWDPHLRSTHDVSGHDCDLLDC